MTWAGASGSVVVDPLPCTWSALCVCSSTATTASASGTSSDDATALVGLPPGRAYEGPEMRIDVSPTLRRLLIELGLGRDARPPIANDWTCAPMMPDTIADRASDLIAAASALAYLREAKTTEATEAARLSSRVQGLVAELVTAQHDDGGWPWVAPSPGPGSRPASACSTALPRGPTATRPTTSSGCRATGKIPSGCASHSLSLDSPAISLM